MDKKQKELIKDDIRYMIMKRSQGMMTSGVDRDFFYDDNPTDGVTNEQVDMMIDELKDECRVIERNGWLTPFSRPRDIPDFLFPIEKAKKLIGFYTGTDESHEAIGRNLAIADPINPENNEALKAIENEVLSSRENVICVDFKDIASAHDLAEEIITQCKGIVAKDDDLEIEFLDNNNKSEENYLAYALEKTQEISNSSDKYTLIFCRNFTRILDLGNKGKEIEEQMGAALKRVGRVRLLFRCENKKKINQIFFSPKMPFFLYASVIDIE